jgi:hypothetical protein
VESWSGSAKVSRTNPGGHTRLAMEGGGFEVGEDCAYQTCWGFIFLWLCSRLSGGERVGVFEIQAAVGLSTVFECRSCHSSSCC